MEIAKRRGLLVVEDCALSLLSRDGHRPLGTYADWAVFCLYKTLALPNGALLTQNSTPVDGLSALELRSAGSASVAGRVAELLVQRVRGRSNRVGAALYTMKRALGRTAAALDVRRANVGDIGFNLDEVDLAMSATSERLLRRVDFDDVRRRRIENYRLLDQLLGSNVVRLFQNLPDGVCPLFFPIVVMDKADAARRLQQRGVDALEFWNESVEGGAEMGTAARYLRAHVLELPVHQDLTHEQIAWVAREATQLSQGLAA
jgi:dTDP-4-amino-4,6-dideoxygalactose transaminase